MKKEKEMISKVNGDDEDNSSVINKGREDDCQVVVQEQQNKSEPSSGNDLAALAKPENVSVKSNNTTDPSTLDTNTDHTSPSILKSEQEGDELKLANYKAKMGEVREENERLKVLLAQIMTDYQSLQSQFSDILRQQEAKISKPSGCKSLDDHHQSACRDDDQLVSLSLGRSSSPADDETRKNEMTIKKTRSGSSGKDRDHQEGFNGGDQLALVLGSSLSETTKNYSKSDNSFDDEDPKELDGQDVEPTKIWPPSKVLKTARSSGIEDHTNQDDVVSQTSSLKKARVSVRARCNAPTMNDGCQWRKYGQKIAKGNPCPRAYYRCTVSPSCPVRKQVQRCAEDMSILITTYEGTHNHPLPISATPMASTTSAAASMLQSRSTTSSSSQSAALLLSSAISGPISTATSSNPTHPPGLNFSTTLFQNSLIKPSPQQQQFYFPNTSISTSNNSHPTVTLDLTLPHHPYSSHIPGGSLSSNISSAHKSYPSTCLSFSSTSSSSFLEPIVDNHYNGYFNFRDNPLGSNGINYNKQPLIEDSTFLQPYLNSINNNNQISTALTNQQSLTETIAAATKAITSNPNFKSALAAALTSFVGNGGPKGS